MSAPARRKLTLDERAALLQTGEEYRTAYTLMQRTAGAWLLGLLVLLALLTSHATVTAQAQMTYTGFGWQRPPALVQNLSKATTRSAYIARRVAPQDWPSRYSKTVYACMQQPKCSAAYPAAWLWWWSALPDTQQVRTAIEWIAGALAISAPVALLTVVDVVQWRQWERRYLSQQHRAEQRRRRAGR